MSLVERVRRNGFLRTLNEVLGEDKIGFLFVLPLLFFFVTFRLYPILRSLFLSFMSYEFVFPSRSEFVGLGNFIQLFHDPRAAETAWITVKYLLIFIPGSILMGLIAAVLVDKIKNQLVATVYRVAIFLPMVLPFAIAYFMWKWIYDPQWSVLNRIIVDIMGISWPWQSWIYDTASALPSIAFVEIWRLTGFNMMILLVGLNSINRSLYDVGKIDGANAWQLFRHITLPLLTPFILITFVLRLKQFAVIMAPLIMTSGGPGRATMTFGLQAYYIAFNTPNMRMGYASAWFMVLSTFTGVVAYIGWKLTRD